jgi:hypothetical protein
MSIFLQPTKRIPGLHFRGYKKPHWLKDQIRNYSETCRQKKRYGMDSIMIHEQMQNPNE